MATIGDPLADLGLTLAYRDPAFEPVLGGSAAATSPRMPPARSLAEAYARASGRHLDNLDFYVALGYLKAAVIAEGIHARFIAGQTRGAGFDRRIRGARTDRRRAGRAHRKQVVMTPNVETPASARTPASPSANNGPIGSVQTDGMELQ